MNKPSSKHRDNHKEREREKEKSKPKSKDEKNIKKKNHLYKIERVCGNGSFGIVFQGKVLHTGETIAIKKVYQDRRFRNREFSIMSLLDHPNIVKVRHAFYTTGEKLDEIYLNLVMNYVPENLNRLNKSLFEKKEQLPVFLIKLYCFQIARALNYIHNKKICHRDIKPQNILLDPQTNRIYICDFGSAKLLKREESNVSYICSRFYRAPELLLGNEYYTTSIDIWSFGCVLAELFKGKPLLRTENKDEQINKIMECLGGPKEEDLAVIIEKDAAHELAKSTKGIKGKNLADVLPNCPSDLIDLLNEDSQKKAEEFQKENQILQNRIKKLEEIIQNNKIENQNLLNTSDNYLKIIEQQKIIINNLKEQINLKEECAQILEENNNFILNNFNI